MLTVSLFSLLCYCAILGHAIVLNRAPQTSLLPAPYANSTTGSTISPTLSSSPSLCTGCQWGEPREAVSFNWPVVYKTELVLATIVYKVNPDNITSTITRYSNQTLGSFQYTLLDAAQWNSILSTTGVTVENETPYFKYVTTIYTAPNAPFTVSSTLTSPKGYTNWGWIYYTVNSTYSTLTSTGWRTTEAITGCVPGNEKVLFAITPTATPPGYTNPYEAPVGAREWAALVPSSVKEKCTREPVVAPQVAIQSVSALTETSTEFEDGPPRTQTDPGGRQTPSAPVSLEPQVTALIPPALDIPPAESLPVPQPPLSQRPRPQPPQAPPQAPTQVPPPTPNQPQPQPQPQPPPPSSGPSPSNIPILIPIIIGTQTLTPGSPAITVSGIPISIPAPAANPNPVNGPQNPSPAPSPNPSAPVIVIGTQTLTLTPNAPATALTISGTPISLPSNPTATALIIDGTNTVPITQLPASASTLTIPSGSGGGGQAIATLGNGQTITLLPGSSGGGGLVGVVGSQTQTISLSPGGAGVTVEGVGYSLGLTTATSGTATVLVVDGQTVTVTGTGGGGGSMSTMSSGGGAGGMGVASTTGTGGARETGTGGGERTATTSMTGPSAVVSASTSGLGGGEVFTGAAPTLLKTGRRGTMSRYNGWAFVSSLFLLGGGGGGMVFMTGTVILVWNMMF